MEVASVGASGAYVNNTVQSARPQQAQETQQVERREPPREERSEAVETAPQPVVNAQGQTTGTLVNVTA